jgi:D-alanyl-D-alanine carboxypeptidase (penicillin-binding protein 5/6)
MQRHTKIAFRFGAWLCIFLLLPFFLFSSLAEDQADEEKFIPPEKPSDANSYDPEHPENLQEDQITAKSAILIEANTGEVIFEKNADQKMYPASTTKIMTVFLGLTIGKTNEMMDETVTISEEDLNLPENSSVIPMSAGETIRFEDLLYATMVRSGNEGANAIAEAISGSVPNFVDLMNETANYMGCTSTHFANPNGLHDENHYTTARDMSIIAKEAMNNSIFRQIAATTSYSLPKSNMQKARTVKNSNNALMVQGENNKFFYGYVNGIKTGFTNPAGYCYVGSASKNGVSLISVILYSDSTGRWTDTKKLMEYGFSQYVSVSPVELYDMNPIVLETTGFSKDDPDLGRLPLNLVPLDTSATAAIVATRTQVESMARDLQQLVIIEYIRDFAAPIDAGEQMGTLTYFPPDGSGDPVEYGLVASRSINVRENAPKSIEQIIKESYEDPNPFPRITIEMIFMALLPVGGLFLIFRITRRVSKKFTGKGGNLPKPTSRRYR